MSDLPDTHELTVRIHGSDDYWMLMLDSDAWSAKEIADECGVERTTIAAYVQRLIKGGYVETAGREGRSQLYRLIKRPLHKPRLKKDGSLQEETKIETLWRSMRMAKTFTAASLLEFSQGRDEPISKTTVRLYMRDLTHVGIIAAVAPGSNTFCLVQNLGARAPRILSTRIVFDPNSLKVVGIPTADEVLP